MQDRLVEVNHLRISLHALETLPVGPVDLTFERPEVYDFQFQRAEGKKVGLRLASSRAPALLIRGLDPDGLVASKALEKGELRPRRGDRIIQVT